MGWRLLRLLEWIFWHITVPILRLIAPLFFDRAYLTGRHFTPDGQGWRWVSRSLLTQRILRFNRHLPFPAAPFMEVSSARNLSFHPDDLNNLQSPGCYFQNIDAMITIGRGTYIAPNVGIITTNHDPQNLDQHLAGKPVTLGPKCWLGMNSVILPGVTLGPQTIVGAGAVVTKSFPEGHVTIVGSPAKPVPKSQ